MIRLLWAFVLSAWAMAALAQAHAPFVDEDGLLRTDLRHSELVARLGPPPLSEVEREVTEGERVLGGHWWVAYPALGLVFSMPRHERSEADPRIDTLLVRPPWTPQPGGRIRAGLAWGDRSIDPNDGGPPSSGSAGAPHRRGVPVLALGLAAPDLRAHAAAHHRVLPATPSKPSTGLTLAAAGDSGPAPARTLTVHLRDERVVGLDYRRARGVNFPGGAAGLRLARWSAAIGVLLLALTIHLRLPAWLPRWVDRARAIDDAQPVVRGRRLWPLRALGGAILLIGAWLCISQIGWQPGSSSAVVALEGPLLQAVGAVLMALGLVLGLVPKLHYQPMRQLVGTLWGSALLAAAALAGWLPQWPMP
jgi:hypothetical protein